jgi:hypothetical protein
MSAVLECCILSLVFCCILFVIVNCCVAHLCFVLICTRVASTIIYRCTSMSTSWLLGNVYMAMSCKGEKRDTNALKLGPVN